MDSLSLITAIVVLSLRDQKLFIRTFTYKNSKCIKIRKVKKILLMVLLSRKNTISEYTFKRV